MLYQQDLLGLEVGKALGRASDEGITEYARNLVLGVEAHRKEIDALLAQHLIDWSLDRLGHLERAILRLGAYELLWEPDVPAAVAIDEAVELAKRFCSDEAAALINGVLGALVEAPAES